MRIVMGVLAAVAIATTAPSAAAAPCDAVSGERAILAIDEGDEELLRGLRLGLMFGVTPASFPQDQIEAASNACSRGEFEANGEIYRVFGGDPDTPPRWATSVDQRTVYLAAMPPPAATLEWARRGSRGPISFSGEVLYVLAVVNGDTRDVFAIFRGMPGDGQLLAAFKDAIEGRLPRVAIVDPRTGETQFAERSSL